MIEDVNASELLVEQTEKRVKTEILLMLEEEQKHQDERVNEVLEKLQDEIKASLK